METIQQFIVTRDSLLAHYEGKAIREMSQKTVYLVQNGIKRPFPSMAAFTARNFTLDNVIVVGKGITEVLLSETGASLDS